MGRTAIGVIAVLSAALLCPAPGHAAGTSGNATMVVISADPEQLDGGGVPSCSSVSPCTYPSDDGSFFPGIRFVMSGPGSTYVSADIWGYALDCSGEPDASLGQSMDLPGGPYIVFISFDPPPAPGDTFGITWNLGDCPGIFCSIHWTPRTIDEAVPSACAL